MTEETIENTVIVSSDEDPSEALRRKWFDQKSPNTSPTKNTGVLILNNRRRAGSISTDENLAVTAPDARPNKMGPGI